MILQRWLVPATAHHLFVGDLELKRLNFWSPTIRAGSENVLIGLLSIQNLCVNAKRLLQVKIDSRSKIESSPNLIEKKPGNLGRSKTTPHNRGTGQVFVPHTAPVLNCPRVTYNVAKVDDDMFSDPSLPDPVDEDQHDALK